MSGGQAGGRRRLPFAALAVVGALVVVSAPVASAGLGGADQQCAGHTATIIGTPGPDHLVGTDLDDVIIGLEGSDVIEGGGGNDWICAGPDADVVDSGGGNDYVNGGRDNDRLQGGEGHDTLNGGAGSDVIVGGAGRDRCDTPGYATGATQCEPFCPPAPSAQIRIAEMRVNGMEQQATSPVCFEESDYRLSADGELVAAHDDDMGGDCGQASQHVMLQLRRCRLANGDRVATIDDFLAVPLTEWYIDLKSSMDDPDALLVHSAGVAIRAIKHAHRESGAVLMLYKVTPAVAQLVKASGIRAGMKGYPANQEQARALIDSAVSNGFEMVCIHTTQVTRELITYGKQRGVWILAWDLGSDEVQRWRELSSSGLSGLLVPRRKVDVARRLAAIR